MRATLKPTSSGYRPRPRNSRQPSGVAVDSKGFAYHSGTLVVKGTTPQGYAAKINQSGTDSVYAVLFDDTEAAYGLALDGNLLYICGRSTEGTNVDGFAAKLDASGTLTDAYILAGNNEDIAHGIALRAGGTAMAGSTTSTNISTDGSTLNGSRDGFLTLIRNWF